MSHKTEIYGNYLAKWNEAHASMILPERIRDYHKIVALQKEVNGVRAFTAAGKTTGWNACDGVYQLPDGRVVELNYSREGLTLWYATIYPSRAAFDAYDEPMSPRAYFEEF